MSTKPFIAARVEEVVDRAAERGFRALRWREAVTPYAGYGTPHSARVLGRVVLRPRKPTTPLGKVTEEFVRRRGFRNFVTAVVVRGQVTITLGSKTVTTTADRGGYVDVIIPDHGLAPGWHTATLKTAGSKESVAHIRIVSDDETFGIISDIDDTILSTWLPRPLIAFWNSFIRDESNRQAIPGMAVLLTRLLQQHPNAPLFYVSTGAWNTQEFLHRFMRRHAFPGGPLLLTDWGPTNTGWFRSGSQHKRETLVQLAQGFPHIKWILIGDDGQHDPALYAEFAQLYPDRVRAIAIRQLTPTEQMLAHGSTSALEDVEQAPEQVPIVQAPDGRGLYAQLKDLLG